MDIKRKEREAGRFSLHCYFGNGIITIKLITNIDSVNPVTLFELTNYCLLVAVLLKKRKQPPEMFCKERCSKKFRKIHRKTAVLESPF